MSKLDELIAELCPDGVPYVKLNKICAIYDGTHTTPKYTEHGVKFISVENIKSPYDTKKYISKDDFEKYKVKPRIGDVLMTRIGSIGVCTVIDRDEPLAYYVSLALIRPSIDYIDSKFLKYALESLHGRKELRKRTLINAVPIKINKDDIGKITIPLPPMEVQREIVRILNSYTILTDELVVKLTAEFIARKKQYEYYRNILLTRDSNISIKKIEQLCKVFAGGDAPKDVMSKEKTDEYTIPIISNGVGENALYGYTNKAKIKEPAVTVAARGTIGYAEYRDYPYFPIIRLLSLIPNDKDELDTKYLYYCLQGKQYNVPKTGITQLTAPRVKQVEIPVPALPIQKKIVDVLDNFETICSDLNIGLPAEIEARKKQYEYYRDVLLTFVESGKTIQTNKQTDRQSIIKLLQYVFGYVQVELGTIGKVSMCKRILKAETSPSGEVPFYKIGTFGKKADSFISRSKYEEYRRLYSYPKKGDILISASGTIGRTIVYDGEDAYYQDSNIVWIDNDESIVLNKYLLYCYQLQPWTVSTGGTIARLYNDNISKAKICVPSIEEQKRIIEILDKFENICNDFQSVLPAEIEKRQQQYEYYRDKLLSFKEL